MPEDEVEEDRGTSTSKLGRARAWGETQLELSAGRLERARQRSKVVDRAVVVYEHDTESGGGVLAAAVAFRIFLFLVPYTFLLVVGFGLFAGTAKMTPHQIAQRAGVTGLLAHAMSSSSSLSFGARLLAFVSALLATFLAARALIRVLAIVQSRIWELPRAKIAAPPRKVLAFIGGATLVLLSTELTHLIPREFGLIGLVRVVLSLAVPFAAMLALTATLPRPATPWWSLVPGALVVAIGTCVLALVTIYFIAHRVESKSAAYGAIGTALALLGWAYLLGRLMTGSMAANASLWRQNGSRLTQEPKTTDVSATATDRPEEQP